MSKSIKLYKIMRSIFMKFVKRNKFLLFFFTPLIKFNQFFFRQYLRNRRFKKNGELVLKEAKNALDSIGVLFWLDFGTLLGAQRDGEFLPNDLDIDLGLFLSDYSSDIDDAMRNKGFKLIKEFSIDDKKYGLEQTYELKGVTIDLFFYSYNDDVMWTHCFHSFPNLTYAESIKVKGGFLPIEQYLPKSSFEKISFLNENFMVPIPTHDYLSYHYGEDYKVPKSWCYYDLEKDNKNAKFLWNKIGKVSLYK